MNIFVFDLETVPDLEGYRRLGEYESLNDNELFELMQNERRQATFGSTFFPLYLQKIVCISAVLATDDRLNVWSLGDEHTSEAELLSRFYHGIEKYQPTLVSWNGTGFDCPVLNYRTMIHGVPASRYWEMGDRDNQYRWNNYQNRYHFRQLDLMDVLACYQPKANASLDKMATLLGYPGKIGMHGGDVYRYYCEGNVGAIRDYCETDVLNTYLLYLRFELIRGQLTETQCHAEQQRLREWLLQSGKPHFQLFLEAWQNVQ